MIQNEYKALDSDFYDEVMNKYNHISIFNKNGGLQHEGSMFCILSEQAQESLIQILGLKKGVVPEIAYIPKGQTMDYGHTIKSDLGKYSLFTIDNKNKIHNILTSRQGFLFPSKDGVEYGWVTPGDKFIYVQK